MKKIIYLAALMLACLNAARAQNGVQQPYVNVWYPSTLLTWSAAGDTSAVYNRGTVPLATRFLDVAGNPCGAVKNSSVKMMTLPITNASTSGNPSQGYDHAGEYAFGFWQYIDYFVMWGGSASEGIMLAPNATWIDAGHRNGVKVMGLIFLPPTAYGGQLQWVNDLVQTDVNGNYPVADKMLEAAAYYGFDGWFINQETAGGNTATGTAINNFMKYLQAHKPAGTEIIWYDAMLPNGTVGWQGKLNSSNLTMFQDGATTVSNDMFLDFRWSNSGTSLSSSKTTAVNAGRNPFDLYAGIDVQANGYNTSVNWSQLFPTTSTPNTSVGLFVPSWTFHSSPDKNNIPLFYQREEQFWIGADSNSCSTPTSGWRGFAQYIPEKSVISTWPFITRFNTGQGSNGCWINGVQSSSNPWHNQSDADVLPTWRWVRESSGTPLAVNFDFTDAYNGGNALKVSGALSAANATTIRLYNTQLPVTAASKLSITFKPSAAGNSNMKAAVAFSDAPNAFYYIDCGTATAGWQTKVLDLSPYSGKTLSTAGLYFESAAAISNYSMEIGELALRNATAAAPAAPGTPVLQASANCAHADVRMQFAASAGNSIWYYDIFRILPSGGKQWLGRTPNTAYYIKDIKRSGNEAATTIAVTAVSKNGDTSTQSQSSFNWPAVAAPADYVLSFDGINKYLSAGTVNLSGSALTLEGWIYPRSFKTSSPYISSFMGIEENDANAAMIRLGDAGIGANMLQFVLSNGSAETKLTAATALNANTWYHIAATYDGATMKLYINGTLDASMALNATASANGKFYIGRNYADSRCLDGEVEEVRAWKTTRSAADIVADACTVPPATAGLEGYWNFDGGCSGIADDQTGHGHDGALNNLTAADWLTNVPCTPAAIPAVVTAGNEVLLTPDPAVQGAAVQLTVPAATAAVWTLYDAAGHRMAQGTVPAHATMISTDHLSAGMYLVQVVYGHTTVTKKLMIR